MSAKELRRGPLASISRAAVQSRGRQPPVCKPAEKVRFSWRVTRSCLDLPAVIAIGDEVNRVVARELLALRVEPAVADRNIYTACSGLNRLGIFQLRAEPGTLASGFRSGQKVFPALP